jgi:Co/Zn/Cd efflux system component
MLVSREIFAALLLTLSGASVSAQEAAFQGRASEAANAIPVLTAPAALGIGVLAPLSNGGAAVRPLASQETNFALGTPGAVVPGALAAASRFALAAPSLAASPVEHDHDHDHNHDHPHVHDHATTAEETQSSESRFAADSRLFDQAGERRTGDEAVLPAANAPATAFARVSSGLSRAVGLLFHEHHHEAVPFPGADEHDDHDRGHDGHDHHHEHGAPSKSFGALGGSIAVGLTIAAVEYVGGAATGAVALQADALHMASDRVMDAAALASIRFGRGPSARHIEVGVGLLSALALAALGLFEMLPSAVSGFLHPAALSGWSVAGFAALSLFSNAVSAVILSRRQNGHLALRGAFLHASIDAIGALGIVAAAAASLILGWNYALPAVSALLVLLLLRAAWGLGRAAVRLHRSPRP